MSIDWKKIQYFTEDEFTCPCCGKAKMKKKFVEKIDLLRYLYELPIEISTGGGYRCKAYNLTAGGSDDSPHMRGLAVDIKCSNAVSRAKLLEIIYFIGFYGIGIYDKHIHLDDYDRGTKVVWLGKSK